MAKQNESSDILNVMAVNEDTSNALRGKRVSFTGHMGMTRDEMVKFIENHGGRFDPVPKWGTTYLVSNGDWNKGSTITPKKSRKVLAAEANGVKVITEKQLVDIVFALQAKEAAEKAKTGT
jgi:BRCT domain type II-containing protein